jgi:hypothetical protein
MRNFKRVLHGITGGFASLAILWIIFPIPANSIENPYSRSIFPIISWVVIHLTDLFPFSVAGVVLVIAPIVLIFYFTRAIRQRGWRMAWLWQIPLAVLTLYGVFIFVWGANYKRLSIEEIWQLETSKVQTQDLEMLAENLVIVMKQEKNHTREAIGAFTALRESVQMQIKQIVSNTPTLPTQIKATPGGVLLILQTSGVVSPLTLEAHVDSGLPEPFFLAVATHELVHTAGFAGEADTDLIAAVAGLRSSNAYARYCIALTYFGKVLADIPKVSRTKLIQQLPSIAKTDYAALQTAQKQYSIPWLASISQITYNQYLKSQGVEAGVQDYSRIAVLLAAAQNKGLIFR